MAEWIAVFIAAWALLRSGRPRTLQMDGTGPLGGTVLCPRTPAPGGALTTTRPAPAPIPAGTVASVQGPAMLSTQANGAQLLTMAGPLGFRDLTPAKAYVELSRAMYNRNFALYHQIRRDFEV